jgi:hypothetical protein
MEDSLELNIFDIIVGAILLGLGLLYLISQYRVTKELTDKANDIVLENNELYQQYSNIDGNLISDDELYAITMGYREYPIVIDGITIATDNDNYEYNLTLIKDGFYKKSYECNAENEILRIIYSYTGT